eukprot:gnl/MRDRNA2_/MRDRNA2_115649_c0_seq1.p1 gnl/MRDRNA2_/MRDRNA2_115649_c0~~gnl/MRDRNA2_/MRDRNA2_115649_c0_seq1.p1  ORF type:complete len:197 (+),score=49.76 gnl/MRDRNA2_/MRDRNA2_115649_c0_seq1:81-671(+)
MNFAVVHACHRNGITSKRVGSIRREEAKRQRVEVSWEKRIDEVFKQYDTNKSGVLERDQLKNLMQDMNGGYEVPDQDVDDLMALGDNSNEGSINKDEVLFAMQMWQDCLRTLPKIQGFMAKHDLDKTGKLDRAELKKLLEDLNDGVAVPNDEVSWVLEEADLIGDKKIGRLELQKAITLWYYHVEQKQKSSFCNIL